MTTLRRSRRLCAAVLLAPLLVLGCRRGAERADTAAPHVQPPVATPAPATPAAADSPRARPQTASRTPRTPRTSTGAVARADTAGRCTVDRVTDGDTVRCADGRRIRLLLIDAPEMDQPPFGQRARRELSRLLPERSEVRYETDRQRQDRYGRTLAYVYLPDGRMANEEMLRSGHAVVLYYKPNDRHLQRFTAVADSARRQRRGLFADTTFRCMPSAHRRKEC